MNTNSLFDWLGKKQIPITNMVKTYCLIGQVKNMTIEECRLPLLNSDVCLCVTKVWMCRELI